MAISPSPSAPQARGSGEGAPEGGGRGTPGRAQERLKRSLRQAVMGALKRAYPLLSLRDIFPRTAPASPPLGEDKP